MKCRSCNQPLKWIAGTGWCHLQGSAYMMRCDKCGHRETTYPSPTSCPKCGSERRWKHDHRALPVRSRQAPHSLNGCLSWNTQATIWHEMREIGLVPPGSRPNYFHRANMMQEM